MEQKATESTVQSASDKIKAAKERIKAGGPRYLEEAQSVQEINKESFRFKVLLGGHTGTGKTTSAGLTLPGRKLLLDYDGRSQSLSGLPDVKRILLLEEDPRSPRAWAKAEALVNELYSTFRKDELEYDSIIEDGLSSMNRICMNWALLLDPKRGLGGSPAKQHYGPHIKNLSDHINRMLALPVHYVLTCHFNLVQDEETGHFVYLPKVFGQQQRTDVPTWFDECYEAQVETDDDGNPVYFWKTAGSGRYQFIKSSLNQFGKYWKSPFEVNLEATPAGFQKLLDLRYGKEPEESNLKGGEPEPT